MRTTCTTCHKSLEAHRITLSNSRGNVYEVWSRRMLNAQHASIYCADRFNRSEDFTFAEVMALIEAILVLSPAETTAIAA